MNNLRPKGVLDTIFLVCVLMPAAILIAFIVGSLLFTGGQVLDNGKDIYDQVWPWPVFPVPAWLLIAPAAVSAAVVIPVVVMTPVSRAPDLIGRCGQTVVGIGAGVIFAIAFWAPSGLLGVPGEADRYLGLHWVAAALSAFCFVILLLGMVIKLPAHERLRKAGRLRDVIP